MPAIFDRPDHAEVLVLLLQQPGRSATMSHSAPTRSSPERTDREHETGSKASPRHGDGSVRAVPLAAVCLSASEAFVDPEGLS